MKYTLSNLSVGHRLPNGWTVVAYAVVDRHGVVMASNRSVNPKAEPEISYATWAVANDDLRSTHNGHYHDGRQLAFGDFRDRVSAMYLHS